MRRGRILQVQQSSNLGRTSPQRQDDQISPPAPREADGEPKTSVSRPARARGRILTTRLADPRPVATEQPVAGDQARPPSRQASSSGGSETPPRLARQGSDVSSSSVISQQFAKVGKVSYKACIPKGPTNQGAPIQLSLNYMTFEASRGTTVEEYHVEFNPDVESIRLRYRLLRTDEAKEKIGSTIHWTGTNLYLPTRLPQDVTLFETKHPVTDAVVKIRLTYVKSPPDSELLPFYNSLMHKVLSRLKYVIINRQHYSPMHKIAVEQHKLEVWPGWVTSIQRLDGGLKLAIDSSFRVLRMESVLDIMVQIKQRCRGVNLKEAIEQELIGSIIMTSYNNKAYRIDGFDFSKKPTDTFLMSRNEERQISYVDYMKEHWNTTIRDQNQPLIIHNPKPKRGELESPTIYLIPEICMTTGLTADMRANFSIMKSIAEHTRLPPDVRESKLAELLEQMSTDERATSVFGEWNLSFRKDPDVVSGRRLDAETVYFGNQRSAKVPDNADWTRPATCGPVFKSVDIESWVIMYTERDSPIAEDLMTAIKDVSRNLNIKFQAPRLVKLPNDAVLTYVNYAKKEVRRTDQMVMLLTPGKSQREDRYNACKRLFSCELPVPCQFLRCGIVADPRKIRSIVQKVVIQMLSKVGGQPWAMKFPMKSFMIVGIDVYHDTIDRKKSCVGFVASMNEYTSSWWSKTSFQDSLEEISQKINVMMVSALRKYHSFNGFLPQRVIVYRDGVGDGQMDTVVNFEVVQLMNAIKFYMRDSSPDQAEPKISYIIVQKRINAKLSLRSHGRITNPLPGSYLDHTITHPEYNDFYLVSQHVNQGTVSPTKYVVLTETGTLKLEHHQKLAYKMTHMYYNWCGTIRVPAPCQYAHKLAYLTGQNIRQSVSEKLDDKLYYL